jgi:hypothetical protein
MASLPGQNKVHGFGKAVLFAVTLDLQPCGYITQDSGERPIPFAYMSAPEALAF